MRVFNISHDNPKLAANPANQIFYSFRHFPELRQSINEAHQSFKRSGEDVLTNQYRPGSAYKTRSKSPHAQQTLGRHNSDKIYLLQHKMQSLRHSSLNELTTLKEVRDQIRSTSMTNRRPVTRDGNVTAPFSGSRYSRPSSASATISHQSRFSNSKSTEMDESITLHMVLKKFESSGFPGYYDGDGQYLIDGDGLLAVLGISSRIPKRYENEEIQQLILTTLGIPFSIEEVEELRQNLWPNIKR
jgi:hypothetical protein